MTTLTQTGLLLFKFGTLVCYTTLVLTVNVLRIQQMNHDPKTSQVKHDQTITYNTNSVIKYTSEQ